MTAPKKQQFVQASGRKPVARPQPPMKDGRTKRERDRSAKTRNAIDRSRQGE